ncbi:MAG: 16S rRNA (uracil(1498)-N(3))-methyltransferase [Candidatus Omnitrophica bacterium]|nr:16S rRNA (uracil(1498)-N(3))-methyltransferase [Candidatus Omnitrophota bacterium]
MRLKPGDSCLIADGTGREVKARIENFTEDGKTHLIVLESKISPNHKSSIQDSGLQIRVCQALLQKGKMDDLVRKAQELGVDEICPMETSRTVLRMNAESGKRVLQRWEKIAREAAKQSGSLQLVKITNFEKFSKILQTIPKGEVVAVFHPSAKAVGFRDWIKSLESVNARRVNLFLGPEGGFAEEEIKNLPLINLGQNILKADTAFLAVVSALRLFFPKGRDAK